MAEHYKGYTIIYNPMTRKYGAYIGKCCGNPNMKSGSLAELKAMIDRQVN